MLSLAPRKTRPRLQMSEAMKMFQPELRERDISFDYSIDPTYAACNVDYVLADLVRVS